MADLKDWALGVASKVSKVAVTERQVGDVMIIGLEGNIITGASADAARGLTRRLLDEGHRKILLDMAEVMWVDSTGLGTLVSSMVTVTRAGGQIKLLKVRGKIKDLLTTTGLDTIFATYDDELEALNDYE